MKVFKVCQDACSVIAARSLLVRPAMAARTISKVFRAPSFLLSQRCSQESWCLVDCSAFFADQAGGGGGRAQEGRTIRIDLVEKEKTFELFADIAGAFACLNMRRGQLILCPWCSPASRQLSVDKANRKLSDPGIMTIAVTRCAGVNKDAIKLKAITHCTRNACHFDPLCFSTHEFGPA